MGNNKPVETTGVDTEDVKTTGVEGQPLEQMVQEIEDQLDREIDEIQQQEEQVVTKSELTELAEQQGRDHATSNCLHRLTQSKKGRNQHNNYVYLLDNTIKHKDCFKRLAEIIADNNPVHIFDAFQKSTLNSAFALFTKQMSVKRGLKVFGKDGAEAQCPWAKGTMYCCHCDRYSSNVCSLQIASTAACLGYSHKSSGHFWINIHAICLAMCMWNACNMVVCHFVRVQVSAP